MNPFVLAISFIVIFPRMPFDSPWSIGGHLSNPFRRLLLVKHGLGLLEWIQPTREIKNIFKYLSWSLSSILTAYCSLLTPYLLRRYLVSSSNRNIRSLPAPYYQPGFGLQPWMYAIAVLILMGCYLRIMTGNDVYWILKKVGDSLSVVPVYQTLALYEQRQQQPTTSQPSNVRFRPYTWSVPSQLIMSAEFVDLVTHLIAIGKKILLFTHATTREHPWVVGSSDSHVYVQHLRILCHGIFLNQLDEQSNYSYYCGDEDATQRETEAFATAPDKSSAVGTSQELVRL